MASAILSEVRGTTDTVGPFSSVPVESVFTVLARWVKLSPRRGPLMEKASSVFLTDPSFAVTIRRGEDWREKLADSSLSVPLGCLDVVLSSPRTDLYLGALLLYTELLKLEKNANRTAEAADDRDTSERKTLPSSLRSLARLETPFQKSGQPLGHVCERLATHTLDAFLSRCYGVSRDGEISFTGESVRLVALLIALYYQIVHTDLCRVSAFYACLSLLEPLLVCLSGARMESMYVTVMQVMQTQILWSLDAYAMGILATQETANATQEYPIVAKNLGQQTKLLFTETLFEYSCRLLCCDPYETVFLNLKFFSHEARTILTDEVLRKRLASGATSSTAVPFFPLHHNTMESLVACAHRPSGTTALPEPDLFVDDVEKLERSSTNEGTGLSLTDVAASREECTGGRFTKADKAEVKEEAYITLCLALARQITLFDRAPVCPSELESNRYFMWFLLRGFFEHLFSPLPDKTPFDADKRTTRLEQYLQPAGGSHEPGSDYVYCQMEAPIILRCEFVSMEENRRPNASYLPGTVMFVTTSDDELIFLEPPVVDQKEMTQELETGLCKRRIVFTLDLDYIQAKCSKSQNFKIYIKSVTPHKMVDLTLVFRDHISALSAVECINMTAKRNRRRGASFSYGLLNYKSALLQYD
ncbi:hypothetical protein ADEAN_000402600 [Angomonas deanei]|uniref:FPL domain-containing protein n=1 Tax=Angomonas deanei TaxID=59799 RepID=A0A7G2CCB8_9TRYP|nr:hypothetical protein ADEAN_000402600 [Angomonas deanei]